MKKLIKVIGIRDEFMIGSEDQFCTKGREYNITYLDGDNFEIIDDSGDSHGFYIGDCDWFKLIYEGDVIVNNEFKLGNKVKVIKYIGTQYVDIGDLAEIVSINKYNYTIKMIGNGGIYYANEDDLKLLTTGAIQQLEIITEDTTTIVRIKGGQVGVAKLFHEDTYSKGFGFVVAAGKALGIDLVEEVLKVVKSYKVEEVKPISKPNPAKTTLNEFVYENPFKVGDIVKGLESERVYGITNTKMTKGIITSVKEGDVFLEVIEHDDIRHIGYKNYGGIGFENFELVEVPELKVGDKIEMISICPTFGSGGVEKGDIGTITRVLKDDTFLIDFEAMDSWSGVARDIKLVEETPSYKNPILKEEVKPTIFKNGDKAKLIENRSNAYMKIGDIGIIVEDSCQDSLKIKLDGVRSYVTSSELELVEDVVVTPTLKPGDSVKVKADLITGKRYDNLNIFVDWMEGYLGKTSKIVAVTDSGNIKLEGFKFFFTPSMLDLVTLNADKITCGNPFTIKVLEECTVTEEESSQYKVGGRVTKDQAIEIIKAGGRIKRNNNLEYFLKDGTLFFHDCAGDTRSSGYRNNFDENAVYVVTRI